MADVNAPVLETLVKMNEGTPEASGLDAPDGLLGLETRQPVGAALAAPGSNPTVEMPTASRAPATVVATPLLIDVAGPYGRFIAAAGPSRT